MRRLFACLGVLALSAAHAEEHQAIVERAFEALDNGFQESWAYTETSTKEDVVQVANYDPRLPENERWMLMTVDDRPPTDEETESFLEEKLQRMADRSDNDDDEHVGATIQPDTLSLVEETDDYWLFAFVPADDDEEEEFMQHVDGTLKVVKDGHYVEYLSLKNEAPIKPAFGVKINTFNTHLTFGPAAENGPIVPKSVDVHVQGRAFFAVKFDETEMVRFGNFEFVGEH